MKNIIINFILAIYVVYMLNYFKTIVNVAHPLTYFSNELLYHPIHKLSKPINPVCKLGNILSWFLAIYLIFSGFILDYYPKYNRSRGI